MYGFRRIPCPPPEGWRHGCLSWRLVIIYSIHSINKMSNPGPLRQTGNTNPRRFINAGGIFFSLPSGTASEAAAPSGSHATACPTGSRAVAAHAGDNAGEGDGRELGRTRQGADAAYPLMSPPLQVPPLYRV